MRGKSRRLFEAIEKANEEIPSEFYSYFFDECDFMIDSKTRMASNEIETPDYRYFKDYIADIDKRSFNKISKEVVNAIKNAKYYNDDGRTWIELSSNHTMWELELRDNLEDVMGDEINDYYVSLVNSAADKFKSETGVDLYYLGRSGRHVCVDFNVWNLLDYNKLCQVQRKLEIEVVNNFNNEYGNGTESSLSPEPELNEAFYGGVEFENNRSAMELFDILTDMERDDFPDLMDKWNEITGYPDDVRKKRIILINPLVVKFVEENHEALLKNWEEFSDILTDNNFHTYLIAIENELNKYK